MPTIQNKKSKTEHYVTVEDWQTKFVDKGLDRRFTVIDSKDIQDTVIETPQAFSPMSIEEMAEPEMTRDELKTWLEYKGIEFNPRTSTDKLNQLYLENL